MSAFVDTSALYAHLDPADPMQTKVTRAFQDALRARRPLVTTNYVVVECISLVQRRLGIDAVEAFVERALPVLLIRWVTPEVHARALDRLLLRSLRKRSLVDHVSFEVMREEGIRDVLTLDRDFADEGFRCIPRRKN